VADADDAAREFAGLGQFVGFAAADSEGAAGRDEIDDGG
jgi:hypothetical protein